MLTSAGFAMKMAFLTKITCAFEFLIKFILEEVFPFCFLKTGRLLARLKFYIIMRRQSIKIK